MEMVKLGEWYRNESPKGDAQTYTTTYQTKEIKFKEREKNLEKPVLAMLDMVWKRKYKDECICF